MPFLRSSSIANLSAIAALAVIVALGACGDGSTAKGDDGPSSEYDAGPKVNIDTLVPEPGSDCTPTSIASVVRTFADWGWTGGAVTYEAYRVPGAKLGLESDCPKRLVPAAASG